MNGKKKNANGKAKSQNLRMVNVPMAQVVEYRGQPAKMRPINKRKAICCGTDLVQSLSGTTGFGAAIVRFNPGLSIFASLSIEAQRYDKYRVRSLRLVYYPDVAVVTTQGRVYLAPEYDLRDSAPSTLAKLLAYEGVINNVAHKPIVLECDPRIMFGGVQQKRVRCGPVGSDLELYDSVSFIIATDNCSGTGALGQVMVEYEIEFDAFQLEPATPKPTNFALWNLGDNQAITKNTDTVVTFGEVIIDGLGVTPTAGVFTLPCGMFKVSGELSLTDSSAEECNILVKLWKNGAIVSPLQQSQQKLTDAANGASQVSYTFYITSDGTDTLSLAIYATGAAGTMNVYADESRIAIQAL
jgi:hypothetical protein